MQDGRARSGVVMARLWVVYFFQGMAPGFWYPALTNILIGQGLSGWVAWGFMMVPLGAMISPLISGALADQRVPADRLYAGSALAGAGLVVLTFGCLDWHWNPWCFIGLLLLQSIIASPSWSLLATITLTNIEHPERNFPLVRSGSTLGWVVGGFLTSYWLKADASPVAGYAAAVTGGVGALCALGLPHTPPLGRSTSWRGMLGLDALALLRDRDQLVFFTVTFLFAIPLTGFYMMAPQHLRVLGDMHPTATMTLAQWSELVAMLVVAVVMTRFRLKTLLLWALGLSVLRYGMSAHAGATGTLPWHVAGIALHGVCYTFYFITAQVFLNRRVAPHLKGQAQGLFALVASGLGPLVGAWVCGWLRDHYIQANGQGWLELWSVLGAMIAVCFVIFALCYRGAAGRADTSGE